MIHVQILKTESEIEAISYEWNKLHEQISPRLPFLTPSWVLGWWRAYKRADSTARDSMCVFVFRDADAELVAVSPMFISSRPGYGPIKSNELQFVGADSNITEIRGPLCHSALTESITSTIVRILEERRIADWIQWRGLRFADTELPVYIHAKEQLCIPMYILHLPQSWNELRAKLPRNMKEALRKCYNSLAREKIEFTLNVVERPHEIAPALSAFFALHAARSSALNTIQHTNVFKTERSRKFLHDYCAAMAETGNLRIFQLVVSGEVLACRIGFQFGRELYLYYSGYELDWGRFSIMTTLVAEAIKWSIKNKMSIVNLSTGTDVSKTRWRPDCILYSGGISTRSSPFSQAKQQVFTRLRGWTDVVAIANDA